MIWSFYTVVRRELWRFVHQKERFFAALVRPLVWLFIFGAGFRAALGLSIIPPYQTYITYEVYIVPGLCAMIVLFNAMQSSLAMVYDREMGAMRLLLNAPLPRWWVLAARLVAGATVGMIQCYVFLLIAWLWDMRFPVTGYVGFAAATLLVGMMLGSLGLLISALIRQLQNFAGIMNFVIFPMFFLSTALYPLWRLKEGSPLLARLASVNPFTYCTELMRFALYQRLDELALMVVTGCLVVFFALAVWGYQPRMRV